MFGLSGEHLLILAGVLLIFGPRKLPELGSSIGKAMRNFRESFQQPPSSGQLEARNVETPQVITDRNATAAASAQPVTAEKTTAAQPSTTATPPV